MTIQLESTTAQLTSNISVTGSKSESNRLLILQAIFPEISIENLSNSDDTKVLQAALQSSEKLVDIGHAGTAMRFLTAYFAAKEGREVVLTGSQRMQERPIAILVDTLRQLGAEISYEQKEGFPPLRIKGKKLTAQEVSMKANVSSQYLSALMLIAPSLPGGLKISLESELTSVPYLKMTAALLEAIDVGVVFEKTSIHIQPKKTISPTHLVVESDWSSASYFFSLAALSENAKLRLNSYRSESLQGDSALVEIYKQFGVVSSFNGTTMHLEKSKIPSQKEIKFQLSDTPDIAQTIAVTCLGLKIPCTLTGLHTLKIKETDRLEALKTEIEKFGAQVVITEDSLQLFPSENLNAGVRVATYHDHRMAMAFAPLALKTSFWVEDKEVVSKSYPTFWEDMERMGIAGSTP